MLLIALTSRTCVDKGCPKYGRGSLSGARSERGQLRRPKRVRRRNVSGQAFVKGGQQGAGDIVADIPEGADDRRRSCAQKARRETSHTARPTGPGAQRLAGGQDDDFQVREAKPTDVSRLQHP